MALAAEKELEHVGESKGAADLIHELSTRLDAVWRYDQYIANAEDISPLQDLWRDLKRQDQENVKRIKQLIAEEIRKNCFRSVDTPLRFPSPLIRGRFNRRRRGMIGIGVGLSMADRFNEVQRKSVGLDPVVGRNSQYSPHGH